MELTTECRWCGQGPLRAVFDFYISQSLPQIGRGPFAVKECLNCQTRQINPHPSAEEARAYFSSPQRYETSLDPDGLKVEPIARAESRLNEYHIYASAMKRALPRGGTILDVGGGTGLMLSLIDSPHLRICLEPNDLAAEQASLRGLSVTRLWAEELVKPAASLAGLIMNQSLDHLVRPLFFLRKVSTFLAPGGLILLSGVINPKSIASRLYGPSFRLLHPFHQVYPPPRAVIGTFEALGFELIGFWRPYFKTPYCSPAKFIRALGALTKKALFSAYNGPSPAFPGNCVSYLFRKTIVLKPLMVELAVPSPL
jgi:SAM-dependent methyltransferase